MTMMHHEGYVATIKLDEVAGMFHGEVINTRDVLTFQGKSFDELRITFADTIADYVEWCRERGKVPEPLCPETKDVQDSCCSANVMLGQRAQELGAAELKIRRFVTDLDAACRSTTRRLQTAAQLDREKAVCVLRVVYDFLCAINAKKVPIDDDLMCTIDSEPASIIDRISVALDELKYGIVDPVLVKTKFENRPRMSLRQKNDRMFYKSLYDTMADATPQSAIRLKKLGVMLGINVKKLKYIIGNCR